MPLRLRRRKGLKSLGRGPEVVRELGFQVIWDLHMRVGSVSMMPLVTLPFRFEVRAFHSFSRLQKVHILLGCSERHWHEQVWCQLSSQVITSTIIPVIFHLFGVDSRIQKYRLARFQG